MRTIKVDPSIAARFLQRLPDAWDVRHPEHITLILLLRLAHPTSPPLPPTSIASVARGLGITRQHAYRRLIDAGVEVRS